jgi:transposase
MGRKSSRGNQELALPPSNQYVNERLDHLGIVAGVCEEIGLVAWLDAQDTHSHERVSVGAATLAMVLNGVGFSNRQLYLVPQFFADKPVETLLGPGISATDLNDDCLGRTLDWLYAHDPTILFAGIATQARKIFGIEARQVHVDTTSFSVSGEYVPEAEDGDATTIAITYGYSRDRRADLKQWMLALATTHEGDVPLFLRPLAGNSSDHVNLVAVVEAVHDQLRAPDAAEEAMYVADGAMYSAANMARLNHAGISWISRVPGTSVEAKAALGRAGVDWQHSADETTFWWSQTLTLPQGEERWVIVRTQAGETRARARVQREAEQAQQTWTQRLWHLSHQEFACAADAQAAVERTRKELPPWLEVQSRVEPESRYARRGRPRKDVPPVGSVWHIEPQLMLNQARVDEEAQRRACFIVGTNRLDASSLSAEALAATYKDQGSVERGFRFLKDPSFLASSVFVKKPERIMALSFIMVLCLLIYRLAEHRVRTRLAQTGQTIPDQVKKPTHRPTMRWVFQCFEGIELLHITTPEGVTTLILRLQPLHEQILALLGPPYQRLYRLVQ